MPLRSNPYLIPGPGEIRNKIYCEMFSDLTSYAFLQVSKSTALEAGGILCLRSKNTFYDLRQALLFLRAIPEPWRFSVDTMSVNYQNTNYAHDVFEILRTFPNLRYLNISVGSHVGSPYCESICSEDAKGFWALRNLRRVKLTFSGSRYGIKQDLRRLLRRETSLKTPVVQDVGWRRTNTKYTRRHSQARLDSFNKTRKRSLRSRAARLLASQ
jgi:hypothetical protein